MKKLIYLIVCLFANVPKFSTAQILCIYCYDQNDTISAGVNNLILNGGFENGCGNGGYFCPNSNFFTCNINNWTCTGGGTGTYAHVVDTSFTKIVEGSIAPYFGNLLAAACPTIDTSCLVNIDCSVTGVPSGYPLNINSGYGDSIGINLQQTVNGLTPGNIYVLEFWAGGERNGMTYPYRGLFALNVGFGDTLLREKPTEPITGIGTRYIIEFNATSSSHTIKFTNWGHICNFCTELILDDVRLYTLAELDASVPHCAVGIDNPNYQDIENVFPNPVTNNLKVKVSNNELSEIILYDIASRKIIQKKFTNSVSLNTEQIAKGLYLYEVRSKDGSCKKGKVVKD